MSTFRRPPGRPSGRSSTRPDVLAAARDCFLERGYEGATLRLIAARAGVDVSTVVHHCGPKHELFIVSMAAQTGPAQLLRLVLQRPRHELPRAVAETIATTWSDPTRRRPIELLLAAALTDEQVRRACQTYLQREMLVPLAGALGGKNASARAAAVLATASGALLTRYALGVGGGTDEDFRTALERSVAGAASSPRRSPLTRPSTAQSEARSRHLSQAPTTLRDAP